MTQILGENHIVSRVIGSASYQPAVDPKTQRPISRELGEGMVKPDRLREDEVDTKVSAEGGGVAGRSRNPNPLRALGSVRFGYLNLCVALNASGVGDNVANGRDYWAARVGDDLGAGYSQACQRNVQGKQPWTNERI